MSKEGAIARIRLIASEEGEFAKGKPDNSYEQGYFIGVANGLRQAADIVEMEVAEAE